MKSVIIKCPIVLVGLFFILLIGAGCKVYNEEDYKNVNLNNVITLTNQRDGETIRADGVETITFTAQINPDTTERKISFSTTSGTFIDSGKTTTIDVLADGSGVAKAKLRVGTKPGGVEVIAKISDYRAVVHFSLQTAHADKIVGETSTKLVKKDGSINAVIKAYLSRHGGAVSVGTEVEFTATQKNAQGQEVEVGRFIGAGGDKARSDANQVATLTFSADKKNVLVREEVKIRIATKTDNNTTIHYMVTVNVIE